MRRISVISRVTRVVVLSATTALAGSAAFAAASNYAFEPVNAEMNGGEDVTAAHFRARGMR
jgi:hypothetical protein